MRGARFLAATLIMWAICVAPAVRAQEAKQLEGRLDSTTRTKVLAIVEEAEKSGLPTRPLVAKALEGASKGASGERIVLAVRAQLEACRRASGALGASATEAEIVAGASALAAGVPVDTLVNLRSARPHGSLVVPIVVLSDMVARRVPIDVASHSVLAPTRAGAKDTELFALRQRVEEAIRSGVAPASAATLQSKAWLDGRNRNPGHETGVVPTVPGRKGDR